MRTFRIINADVLDGLRQLPDESVHCCVTSPPYWGLRDYGVAGQIGLERTPEAYVARMVEVFREVRRVLRADGTCWINLGDSYASNTKGDNRTDAQQRERDPGGFHSGSGKRWHTGTWTVDHGLKPKDLVGIPWRVAFALQADGWYLRSDVIWAKPNPMPESVTDRPTKAHEYLFLLAKSERYYFDAAAIAEAATCDRMRGPALHPDPASTNGNDGLCRRPLSDTRNRRTVWSIATEPCPMAHFAVMPTALVEPCILAGSPEGGTVLDPFNGSGTVGVVALRHNREYIGVELNPEYVQMAYRRIEADAPLVNISPVVIEQDHSDLPLFSLDGGAR